VSSLLRKYGLRFAWTRSGDQDLRLTSREIVDGDSPLSGRSSFGSGPNREVSQSRFGLG